MTEKEHNKSVMRLLSDLNAAKAFLSRAECQIRNLVGSSVLESQKTRERRPETAFDDADKENTHANTENAVDARFRSSDAISPVLTQSELFKDSGKVQKKIKKQSVLHKKGCITLSRKEVMDNLRRFSAQKPLLDLADVNRILGFHKSTSGSVVRLAIQRGELGYVPVGTEMKFLPVDVRSFVASYFRHH